MARWRTADSYTFSQGARAMGPHVGVAIVVIAAAFLALLCLVPTPLFLPTLSLVSLALAGVIALTALHVRAPHQTKGINLWDIAGACAFAGFAAGMISQPEQVLQLFGLTTKAE